MPLPLEDQLAIQHLMARYVRACDHDCTEQDFLSLFTDDAVMTSPVTGHNIGTEGLKQFRRESISKRGNAQSRHFVTNYIIDGHGDRAQLEAYFLIFRTELDPPLAQRRTVFRFCGSYLCTLRKQAGEWKLQRRDVHIDDRSDAPVPRIGVAGPA